MCRNSSIRYISLVKENDTEKFWKLQRVVEVLKRKASWTFVILFKVWQEGTEYTTAKLFLSCFCAMLYKEFQSQQARRMRSKLDNQVKYHVY